MCFLKINVDAWVNGRCFLFSPYIFDCSRIIRFYCVLFFVLFLFNACPQTASTHGLLSILHVLLHQVSSTAFQPFFFFYPVDHVSSCSFCFIGCVRYAFPFLIATGRKKLEGHLDISRTSSLVDDMDFSSEYIPLSMVTDASQWVQSTSCIIRHEFKSFIHQCTYPPSSTHWMWPINYVLSYTESF